MSLLASPDALSAHRFGTSTAFRVGVEEELFLVDPRTLQLSASVDALLAATSFTSGRAVGEICDGVVEFITPVCDNAGDGVGRIGAGASDFVPPGCDTADVFGPSLASLRQAACAAGATLIGAGV